MAKNEVAVAEDRLPVDMAFLDEIAGKDEGEVLTRDDVSIPFLRILQKLSPQCDADDAAYNPEAKPGMLLNTVTGELIDLKTQVMEFVPIMYKRSYIEWIPRKDGGGMVREYPYSEGEFVEKNHTIRDDSNNDVIQRGAPEPFGVGNHLLKTHTHVIRYRVDGGPWSVAVISMTKTQLKTSTQMNALVLNNPRKGKALRYLHLMKASTVLQSKGDDKWYIWHFDRIDWAAKEDIIPALEFRESLLSGEVKVDMEKSVDDGDGNTPPASSKTADELDDEVPF